MYQDYLLREFQRLASELLPATVYLTVLWRDRELCDYLADIVNYLDAKLGDNLKPVFVTEDPNSLEAIAKEHDAPIVEMPIQHFSSGIRQVFESRVSANRAGIALPSLEGVSIEIPRERENWIAEEIELVPLDSGGVSDESDMSAFLRGGAATWADLNCRVDAQRDIQHRLTRAIETDLQQRRATAHAFLSLPPSGRGWDHGGEAGGMGASREFSMRFASPKRASEDRRETSLHLGKDSNSHAARG